MLKAYITGKDFKVSISRLLFEAGTGGVGINLRPFASKDLS